MRLRCCAAILLICAYCTASAQGALRLALVGTGLEKDKSHLLDIAEVKLSQDNRLELLERKAIRSVLDEQKLSLSGLVSADQAVAVGKLLRVEVFAFVQSLGPDDPPVLTVFDGFNGARLVDVDLPKGGVDAQVDAIVLGVDRAKSKLVAGLHDRTLCLLAVRNADLPRQMDGLCDATAKLLERRLLDSNDIRLLERKRLEAINRERQLGTLDAKHDILASVVAIELEFARAADGDQPTVTALLSDAAGKPLADAQGNPLPKPSSPVDSGNLAAAVNQLTARIADAIAVNPGQATLDPLKESRRFRSEAQFLLAHGQISEGAQAAESAYALAPNAPNHAFFLGFALLDRANQIVRHKENDADAFEMATRAMEVRDNRIINLRRTNLRDDELFLHPDNLTFDFLIDVLTHAHQLAAANDAQAAAATRQIGDAYLAYVNDWLKSSETRCAGNQQFLSHHIEYVRLNHLVRCMALASASRTQYVEAVCGLYERYFALLAAIDPHESLKAYLVAGRDLGDMKSYWEIPERHWTPRDFDADSHERIEHLFSVLTDNVSPAVRFYGLWNQLRFEEAANRLSGSAYDALLASTTKAAREAVDDPVLREVDHAGFEQNLLWGQAMSLLSTAQPKERRLADRLDWYDFIIQRKEIPELAIVRLPEFQFMKATGAQTLDVLTRLNKLASNPDCTFIGFSAGEGHTQLASKIRYLAQVYPEVRQAFVGTGEDVRNLLKIGGPILAINEVVADAHSAYAIVLADDHGQYALQPMALPLDRGAPSIVGSLPGNAEVHDACITDTYIAIATDHGIFVYPRNSGSPFKITSSDGLPTDAVDSVAILDDIIYAGLGDKGYFISYDLRSRKCTVLASSRRKQKSSPFDDTPTFSIIRVIADAAKHRILLVHCREGQFAENGLWQLDPDSGKFTQIITTYFKYRERDASHLLPDGRMVISSNHWALAFDTRDDTTRVLFADNEGVGPTLKPKVRPFTRNEQVRQPFCVIGDDLWAGDPLSRISPETNDTEPIDLPSKRAGRACAPGQPSRSPPTTRAAWRVNNLGQNECEWIVPLADGEHVVVGNAQALWLVPAPAKTRAQSPSSRASP